MRPRVIPGRSAARRGVVGFLRDLVQRSVLRPYLYLTGMLHLRRGRLADAESCLCRAALISPRCFATRVQLGRVYFLMDEFGKAERQFLKAQEIDPARFRPADPDPWPVFDADHGLGERGGFPDEEANTPSHPFEEDLGADRDPRATEPDLGDFRHGDFSSHDEWLRFRDLPPITRAEIAGIDWDRLSSDLTT